MKPEEAVYFIKNEPYTGSYPKYYSADSYPWVKTLEMQYEIIRDELQTILNNEFQFETNINPPALSRPFSWTNIYFLNFLWTNHETCQKFPKTYQILQSIPNLVLAGITVLRPHSQVLPHTGETNTTIRCHFGIKVPARLPVCGLQVGGESRSWEEGKVVMFNDAYEHSTWNHSEEDRVIILIDIVKNEYARHTYWISCKCLATLSLKVILKKFDFYRWTGNAGASVLHNLAAMAWFFYLPVQRHVLKYKLLFR